MEVVNMPNEEVRSEPLFTIAAGTIVNYDQLTSGAVISYAPYAYNAVGLTQSGVYYAVTTNRDGTYTLLPTTPSGTATPWQPATSWEEMYQTQVQRDEEYRRAEAERSLRYAEEYAARQKQRQEAEECAYALLYSTLSTQQRRTFKRYQHINVESTLHPGCIYRIFMCHVEIRYKRRTFASICVQASGVGWLPTADTMLLQKLCIEAHEEHFLAVGNLWCEDDENGSVRWPT